MVEQKQTKHCKGILQWRTFYKIDARKKREMGGSMTKGMYGAFGGQYAPETLMIALEELENA